MANSSGVPKRAWKLQEFVAHGASVNCVSLGHKSGRVLVTGGDDKKVNLWAVGKPNCIMSLCGHTTAIECVRFGQTEELVVAGSASGALKIWDLEAARLIRTLTGHKAGLTCADFHPYGDFLASGSADKNLKLWDIRRKGCIFTYKGHANRVNSLRFSPDGQWIASAGEDAAVKVWDLRAGKMMAEFGEHGGPVHDVEFHPHEFLLASASQDRTVSFWDLETFSKLSSSEKDTGPVRCLSFHPEGNVLFSGSQDSLKFHRWEPSAGIYDHISMGWGKIRDMAVAATQMIGVAYNMSNVSVYVVDLKRTQPFLGGNLFRCIDSSLGQSRSDQLSSADIPVGAEESASPEPHLITSSTMNPRGKPGQPLRKSFVKEKLGPNGQRPSPQVKISEEQTSSTDPEDSSGEVNHTDITDVQNYENIFKPRRQELNRTPEPTDNYEYELFQPPMSGSESESNLSRPSDLRLRNVSNQGLKRPSPSPTRRISQPNPPAPGYGGSPVRARRGSNPSTPTGNIYKPIQEQASSSSAVLLANHPDSLSGHPVSNDISVTPTRHENPQLVPPGQSPASVQQPGIPSRSSSLNRNAAPSNMSASQSPSEFAAPHHPVSRVHIREQNRSLSTPSPSENVPVLDQQRPLDKPTLVKPQQRTSVHIQPDINELAMASMASYQGEQVSLNSPSVHDVTNIPPARSSRQLPNQNHPINYNLPDEAQAFYQQNMMHGGNMPSPAMHQPPPMPHIVNHAPSPMITPTRRQSQPRNIRQAAHHHPANDPSGIQTRHISPSSPEKKMMQEVVPMNADKPTGLQLDEFLPRKFSGLGLNYNTKEGSGSKFSSYKNYGGMGEDMSESEVTSSILKGHDAMMAVLTTRGRNMEIIQKLWQGKDAKAAVDQAVSLNDQAIMVDFLSVITLRPSIWNLDLCESLLPVIGDLLQSKYEMYINVGCGAMKLILKNFASVIKSNIDSPIQTVGVDISREERHRKCMQCYKDLVKTRALILKRQSMQGKLGHSMRELAILMQYID